MKSPAIVQRHPELWWLVAVVAIVAVAVPIGTSVSGVFRNQSALPATSPDALVASVQEVQPIGYAGTITSQVDLDLPSALRAALVKAVPAAGAVLNGSTHTLQYWYGGEDRQRVALRLRGSEQDVFRNGSQLTTWDTASRVAQTSTVQQTSSPGLSPSAATPLSLTPPQLADALLDLVGETSETSLRSGDSIAGRATYELVLRPTPTSSRVGEVQIQIDGKQFVPLGVKVFAHDADVPAINVSFTSIRYGAPAERNFTFSPPPGSATTTVSQAGEFADPLASLLGAVQVRGSGWTSVARYQVTARQRTVVAGLLGGDVAGVKGKWGRGRLLSTPLLCVLVTAEGVIVVGAVAPAVLYAAVD